MFSFSSTLTPRGLLLESVLFPQHSNDPPKHSFISSIIFLVSSLSPGDTPSTLLRGERDVGNPQCRSGTPLDPCRHRRNIIKTFGSPVVLSASALEGGCCEGPRNDRGTEGQRDGGTDFRQCVCVFQATGCGATPRPVAHATNPGVSLISFPQHHIH